MVLIVGLIPFILDIGQRLSYLAADTPDRTSFATRNQARSAVFDYIEGFYNPTRRHSTNGYQSPADYERSTQTTPTATLAP